MALHTYTWVGDGLHHFILQCQSVMATGVHALKSKPHSPFTWAKDKFWNYGDYLSIFLSACFGLDVSMCSSYMDNLSAEVMFLPQLFIKSLVCKQLFSGSCVLIFWALQAWPIWATTLPIWVLAYELQPLGIWVTASKMHIDELHSERRRPSIIQWGCRAGPMAQCHNRGRVSEMYPSACISTSSLVMCTQSFCPAMWNLREVVKQGVSTGLCQCSVIFVYESVHALRLSVMLQGM